MNVLIILGQIVTAFIILKEINMQIDNLEDNINMLLGNKDPLYSSTLPAKYHSILQR